MSPLRLRTELMETAEWWVLVATVAISPLVFSRWTFDVFNITELTTIWLGLTLAVALRVARLPSDAWPRVPPIWPYVLAYVGVLALTTLTSRAPIVSFLGNYGRLGGMVTIVPVVVLAWFLAALMAGHPGRRRQLLAAMAVSSTVGAMYLIGQQLDLDTYAWLQFGGREPTHPPGLLGNANFSGAHVALGVGPMVWLAATTKHRARVGWLVAMTISLAGIGVSQSRGSMLAAAVGLVLMARLLKLPKRRFLTAAAVAVVLLGAVTLATSNRGLDDVLDVSTRDQRVDLWVVALRGSPDQLLLGGGPDLYVLTFRDHAGAELEGVISNEPHNVLLDQLDGSGLAGAATWIALVAAVGVMAACSKRRDMAPWTVMGVAYLTQSVVSIDAVPLLLWAWVVAAGVTATTGPDGVSAHTPHLARVPAMLGALVVLVVGLSLAIQPFRADMAYRRGIIASNAGDSDAAIEDFEQAITRHPREPHYQARLGLELWSSIDLLDPVAVQTTRDQLQRALDLFPSDPSATAWLDGLNEQVARVGG